MITFHISRTEAEVIDIDRSGSLNAARRQGFRILIAGNLIEFEDEQDIVNLAKRILRRMGEDERKATLTCDDCGRIRNDEFFMCDMAQEKYWCPDCFLRTPCGSGEHEDGCATKVWEHGRQRSRWSHHGLNSLRAASRPLNREASDQSNVQAMRPEDQEQLERELEQELAEREVGAKLALPGLESGTLVVFNEGIYHNGLSLVTEGHMATVIAWTADAVLVNLKGTALCLTVLPRILSRLKPLETT